MWERLGGRGQLGPSPSPARGDSALPVLQELAQEELFVAVEMLSAVVLINRALEAKDASGFWSNSRTRHGPGRGGRGERQR